MQIKVPVSESSIMSPDSKLYNIRSPEPLERGTGLGAYVGQTPDGLSIFRSDVHVSARGERRSCVTFLVNKEGSIIAENEPKAKGDGQRRMEQQNAIQTAKTKQRVWTKPDATWYMHPSRTQMDTSMSEAVASTVSGKDEAAVMSHEAVKRLFQGYAMVPQVETDGTFFCSGRRAVWVWNDDGGDRRVVLYDGDRQAKGEGKTIEAALTAASKKKFTKIARGKS